MQLNSTGDRERNVARAERLVRDAADAGAELVVLPEKFTAIGTPEALEAAAEPLDGPTLAWSRALAREHGIDLVAGSFTERRPGRAKFSNTSVHVGPDGELKAVYRKIHMFDVHVEGVDYRESAVQERGDEIVVSEAADGTPVGMTVCYDVRFPELYRILAIRGARVITIPAAFTRPTGRAHWEILVRARAIENQAFVVAADQVGEHAEGKSSYGGSLIVDPWGDVLARAGTDADEVIHAELDLARQDELREQMPNLPNRVPGAYRWPADSPVAAAPAGARA